MRIPLTSLLIEDAKKMREWKIRKISHKDAQEAQGDRRNKPQINAD